jgi:calcineurin-like phosphoesterase family protein
LWDPKDFEKYNIIKDFIEPFFLLSDINCNKIYVTGNHDDSLGEFEGKVDFKNLYTGTRLDIYNGYYPKKDNISGIAGGLKVGSRSYLFLHGHQFDKSRLFLYMYQTL